MIVDLHCHPSLKPYNNEPFSDALGEPNSNIWKYTEMLGFRRKISSMVYNMIVKETAKDSQCYLESMHTGDMPGAVVALHPVERGWFDLNSKHSKRLKGWRFRVFLLGLFLPKKKRKFLASMMSGFQLEKIEKIFARVSEGQGVDYYNGELFLEYDFWQRNEGKDHNGKTYVLAKNYDDWKSIMDAWAAGDKTRMAFILSVEGAHSFTNIKRGSHFKTSYANLSEADKEQLGQSTLSNIELMKGSSQAVGNRFDKHHAPFFISLCHMYNNFMSGHAKSYEDHNGILPGMTTLLDQWTALDDGITELGWKAIKALLDRTNGRRVLIDVKHMSARAREEFYGFVDERKTDGDSIPVLFSHGGVNGFIDNNLNRKDTNKLNENHYFSRWSINASNRDVAMVIDSGGILGIALHEGRLPGGVAKDRIKQLKKKGTKGGLKNEHLRLALSHLFHFRFAYEKQGAEDPSKAWDHVCLGSDYDGMMNPFDSYHYASDFKTFMEDSVAFITKVIDGSEYLYYYPNENMYAKLKGEKAEAMMDGLTPHALLEKFMFSNQDTFLSKYFTSEYLNNDA